MIYCDECADRLGWPHVFNMYMNECMICGERSFCNDFPTEKLPEEEHKYDIDIYILKWRENDNKIRKNG